MGKVLSVFEVSIQKIISLFRGLLKVVIKKGVVLTIRPERWILIVRARRLPSLTNVAP